MGAIDSSRFRPDTPNSRCCHNCGSKDFKELNQSNLLLLHWKINPGLAFSELVLGQRIPKITFVCRECGSWLSPNSHYIECPDCKRFHNARIWKTAGLWNWLGIVCPDCRASIPCVQNFTSRLILFFLWPIRRAIIRHGIPNVEKYSTWAQDRICRSRFKHYTDNAG